MPDPLLCTRCGSDAVIPRVRVIDRGDSNMRQIRLHELEERLAFVEQLLEPRHSDAALPKKR